jgi:hypothetical protein
LAALALSLPVWLFSLASHQRRPCHGYVSITTDMRWELLIKKAGCTGLPNRLGIEYLHSLNKKIRISVTRAYPPPKSVNVQTLTSGQQIVIILLRIHSGASFRDSLPA